MTTITLDTPIKRGETEITDYQSFRLGFSHPRAVKQ